MTTVNYYDVLDLTQDCTIDDIKKAYKKLAKEFHPDKPTGDEEMFELISTAFSVLSNPRTRQEYDKFSKLQEQSNNDHFSRKAKATEHLKLQEADIKSKKNHHPHPHPDETKKDFKKAMLEMDRKRNYNRGQTDKSLDTKDAVKLYSDLKLAREQEDIENIPEKLFDGEIDMGKFHQVFDDVCGSTHDLIPHTGNPLAYNTVDGFASNFTPIEKYDELFDEDGNGDGENDGNGNNDGESRTVSDIGGAHFSPIRYIEPKKKISKHDIQKISSASYTKGHNYKDNNYNTSLDEKIRERELYTRQLDNRTIDDFEKDPSCGGYGIFDKIGITDSITWDNEDDVKQAYNRLLELRRKT